MVQCSGSEAVSCTMQALHHGRESGYCGSAWHTFVGVWRRLIVEDSSAKSNMLVMFSVVVQRSCGRVKEMQAGER